MSVVTSLPETIKNLTSLRELHLSNNLLVLDGISKATIAYTLLSSQLFSE
ncbi:hypothetical protein Cha6605_2580 [Chamaesiphon minutus PCC 6605]|uniref:Leucine Rich Repeat (LRR)-containing protein n=1 Tax=Chamaesiphon minutus (strain ATCC 27169 / PCC 6605) TaxID=1173020 RepID=K9UES7_CHAP6|nr:hypothetical protein Cha6605_2580 [Chamaesiphon minutus PCC 6605]